MVFMPYHRYENMILERVSELSKVIEIIAKKYAFLSLRMNPLSLSFCSAVVRKKEFFVNSHILSPYYGCSYIIEVNYDFLTFFSPSCLKYMII